MIPSDITINPLSGYGDSSVDMSMEEYTGRKPLPTREVWVYDADDTTSDMVEVDQYPKEEFIALNDPLSFTMVALGGTVTVTGSSNSASIVPVSFSDQLQFSLEVNGVPQDTWTVDSPGIAGDIGATEQYNFSMTVTVPENRTLEKKTWTFAISNGSHITTAVITIVQDEGVMTYSDIEVSLTYHSVIPASGGSSSPTLTYRQTWGWNGNITNGGVLTSGAEVVYSGDHTNTTTGVVILPSRGTVLGDRLTVVSGVTVSMNGKSTSVQSDVYQEKNVPVEFSVVSDFHYDAGIIPASGGSKSPVLGGYFNITFSSGSVLGNLQAIDAPEGTQIIDTYRTYSMTSAPGFTIDTGNGTVTAENRGTVLGAQRSCGDITSTLNTTLVVSVSYADNDTFIRSSSTTLDSPVSQEGNTIESYYESQADLSWPSPIPASGGISDPTGDRVAGAVLTSGSRTLLADLRDAGYITYTYHRTLTVTQAAEGLSVVNTDQIQASSRGTVVGNDRTIRFNCDDYYDGSILAEYGGGTVYYKFATLAASVTQSKNIPVSLTSQAGFNYPSGDIPASGGSKSPITTGDVTVYFSSGSTTTHSTVSDYNGYTITASSVWSMVAASGFSINTSNGTVTAANRGTTAGERRLSGNVSRTLNWTLTIDSAYGGGTLTSSNSHTEITPVAQAANIATYGAITLNVPSSVIIAAGGQTYTISPAASQTVSFSSGSSRSGSISFSYAQISSVSGFSLSRNIVTAANNQSTSAKTYTVNVTATGEGSVSAVKSVVFHQAAGQMTYSDIILNVSYPIIHAGGGISKPTVTYYQPWGWNGATTGGGIVTSGGTLTYSGTSVSTSNGIVSTGSKGTTISDITTVTTATVTVALNGKSASEQVAVQQAANAITRSAYSNPSVTITSVDTIPASGGSISSGSCTYSQTKTDTYTSGATKPTTIVGTISAYSYPSVSWSTVSAGSKGITVSGITNVGNIICTVTLNGKSGSDTEMVKQAANAATYGDVTISGTASVSDIPARGGSVNSATGLSASQTVSFTSGSTRAGSVTLSYSTVSAPNLATTVKARTQVGTMTATATGEGSKTAMISIEVYQQANSSIDTYLSPIINTPNPSHNFSKDGGTWATGVTVSQNGTRTYTSGSTLPITGSASFTLSENVDWLSTSGRNITATANPTASSRSATVTINATGSGGATSRASLSITQDGGTYLEVSPTSLTFDADGGTKTLTIDTNESWTIS